MGSPLKDTKSGFSVRITDVASTPPASDSGDVKPARRSGYGSTEVHAFSDPSVADYWRKVYERASYENRHRFDPSFQWSADEEKKLVRKVGSPFVSRIFSLNIIFGEPCC